jgi:hypothetical protein
VGDDSEPNRERLSTRTSPTPALPEPMSLSVSGTNVQTSLYDFSAITEMLPGDHLSQAADVLTEVSDLLAQGKKVRVYVVREDTEENQ